jgi:Lamin Tail Domain
MHVKSREYKVIVDSSLCVDLEAALSTSHDETGDLARALGLGFAGKFDAEDPDDATGHRLPGAQPIRAGGSLGTDDDGPTLVTHPTVYIERALVNPDGDEPGQEVVVVGNTTVATVDLTGWSIVDKNNKADVLRGVLLSAGESRRVVLSGNGAQLSNKGGTITLKDPMGKQVHAVSYSKEDADQEDRYIRFTT